MNACLANTTRVPSRILSGKQLNAACAAVKEYLQNNPNLTGFVRTLAADYDVTTLGANASVMSPGSGDERVHLILAGGALALDDPRDPSLAAADKLMYVREGTEPVGVLRALVECLATKDRTTTYKLMTDRIAALAGKTAWREVVIRILFELVRDKYSAMLSMITILGSIAGVLDQLTKATDARVSLFDKIEEGPFQGDLVRILTALSATPEWQSRNYVQLVAYQAWQRMDPAKGTALLTALAATDCQSARNYVDIAYLKKDLGALLTPPVISPPDPGRLRLALLGVLGGDNEASDQCLDYLRPLVEPDSVPRSFGDPIGPLVDTALGGLGGGERGVAAWALPPPGGAAPSPSHEVEANLAAEGDSENKLYVRSVTKTGRIVADPDTALHERPDSAPSAVRVTKDTEVFILGETADDHWYAVEHAPGGGMRSTRFVSKAAVHVP